MIQFVFVLGFILYKLPAMSLVKHIFDMISECALSLSGVTGALVEWVVFIRLLFSWMTRKRSRLLKKRLILNAVKNVVDCSTQSDVLLWFGQDSLSLHPLMYFQQGEGSTVSHSSLFRSDFLLWSKTKFLFWALSFELIMSSAMLKHFAKVASSYFFLVNFWDRREWM